MVCNVRPCARGRIFVLVHGNFGNGGASRFLHRLNKQLIRLASRVFRHGEVRGLVIKRIDVLEIDELLDFHAARRGRSDLLDLLLLDKYVAVLLVFVTLHDFGSLHLALAGGAELRLLDAGFALGVKLVKVDGLAARGREQADRDGDQPESQIAGPNRGRHVTFLSLRNAAFEHLAPIGQAPPAQCMTDRG